jgi:5-aminolevulinate synthase
MGNRMIDYRTILNNRLNDLRQTGSYRYFLEVDKQSDLFPRFQYTDAEGRIHTAINWCSNDYLGMSVHPKVINAMQQATAHCGTGSGGTRNISGTTVLHRRLEKVLAQLHQQEAALLFNGAYQANQTALCTLGRLLPNALFVSDERNHASIIEGIRASGCDKIIFRHNDTAQLEGILRQEAGQRPVIVAVESVYSIGGTVAPLQCILELSRCYNCLSYVDEVHAVGLYGSTGGGLTEQWGLQDQVDIINGTLAKGFGVIGGYITGEAILIDAIRSFGSGFIFTTSLPPAICAAATESITLVRRGTPLRQRLHQNVQLLRQLLTSYGIVYGGHDSHITPVYIGDATLCKTIADTLLQQFGLYLQPVNYPTVPLGEACLRIVANARHTEADIHHLAESLSVVLQGHPIAPSLNTIAQP